MNNVFCTPLKIDYRYDLKGSTQGRITRILGKPIDNTIALKELDFIADKKKFQVGGVYKELLMKIIQKHSEFF
jgi:hypothetical protein